MTIAEQLAEEYEVAREKRIAAEMLLEAAIQAEDRAWAKMAKAIEEEEAGR